MDMIEVEKEIAKATQQLEAELAKEREKVKLANDVLASERGIYADRLATAQATIAEMREKSEAAKNACMVASSGCSHIKTHAECNEARQFAHATKINVETALSALNEALALPTNLDALHEAKAQECERLAGYLLHNEVRRWLREEAAAHRARKEGK